MKRSLSLHSFLTFTQSFKFTWVSIRLPISILAAVPIFFNMLPPFPMIMPLWESLSQTMVASISIIPFFRHRILVIELRSLRQVFKNTVLHGVNIFLLQG